MSKNKSKSAKHLILKSLIPYTKENLLLSFSPHKFFNELDRSSNYDFQTIRNAYYSLTQNGLVELDDQGIPMLTDKGHVQLDRYEPKILTNAQLMVVFDIPEAQRNKRAKLRLALREFKFKQVQKSVWVTNYDCQKILKAIVQQEKLSDYVKIYEVSKIKL